MSSPIHPPVAPADPDADLLARFRDRGDRGAFDELVRRHAPLVARVTRSLCGHTADSDDAAQEAWLRAFRGARGFRGDGSVAHWLVALAANASRDLARSAARRRRREHAAAPPPPIGREVALPESVRAGLAALPERYRAPIALRYLDGLDNAMVAAALDLREGTARMRIKRGLDLLRARLDDRDPGSGVLALAVLVGLPEPVDTVTGVEGILAHLTSSPLPTRAFAPWSAPTVVIGALVVLCGALAWFATHRAPHDRTPLALAPTPPAAQPGPAADPAPVPPTIEKRVQGVALSACLAALREASAGAASGALRYQPPAGTEFLRLDVDVGPWRPWPYLPVTFGELAWKPADAGRIQVDLHLVLARYHWFADHHAEGGASERWLYHVGGSVDCSALLAPAAASLSGPITLHLLAAPGEPEDTANVWMERQTGEKRRLYGVHWIELTFADAADPGSVLSGWRLEGAWAPAP